jgi:hypothetical protein
MTGGDGDEGQVLTLADLDEWVAAGLIRPDQAEAIRAYTARRTPAAIVVPTAHGLQPAGTSDERTGLNLVSIAYYFGAFLILFAYTVFVGLSWEDLNNGGRTAVSAFTIAALWAIGAGLHRKGYPTAGGLLLFAGAAVVPLLVYSLEVATGFWPGDELDAYGADYREIVASWVVMEVAAIAACLVILWLIRFPLLILQAAFWGWFLAMDLTRWVRGSDDWSWDQAEQAVSLVFGLALLGLGVWAWERGLRGEAFWLGLAGHAIVFLNGSFLFLGEGVLIGIPYLLFYLAVVAASVRLQSRTYLVFGALGTYAYVAYLAFSVFEGALGFALGLALTGLAVVLGAVAYQRYVRPELETRFGSGRPQNPTPTVTTTAGR